VAGRHKSVFFTLQIVFLLTLFTNKEGLTFLQGLGAVDILVTGLSAEFLGAIFLFIWLRLFVELSENKDQVSEKKMLIIAATLGALILVSHLIIGLAWLFFVGVSMLYAADKRSVKFLGLQTVLSLGLSAFFWLPFVFFKSALTTASVSQGTTLGIWILFVISLRLLLLKFKIHPPRHYILFCDFLVLITLPNEVLGYFPVLQGYLPKFHYYRFSIVGLFFGFFGIAGILAHLCSKFSRNITKIGTLIVFLGVSFVTLWPLHRFNKDDVSHEPISLSLAQPPEELLKFQSSSIIPLGRSWVIGNWRPVDIGIESVIQVHYPELRSIKGLYWESHKNNTSVSTAIAAILGPPSVIEFALPNERSCPQILCLMDSFIADGNLTAIALDQKSFAMFGDSVVRDCMKSILKNGGTNYFKFVPSRDFIVHGDSYRWYLLEPKKDIAASAQRIMEPLEYTSISKLDQNPIYPPSAQLLYSRLKQCEKMNDARFFSSRKLWTYDEVAGFQNPEVTRESLVSLAIKVREERQPDGSWKIETPSDQARWYRLKLAPLPGLKVVPGKYSEVVLYPAYPSSLIKARGSFHVYYEKPFVIYLGYLISMLFGCGLFFVALVSNTTLSSYVKMFKKS